mmetsp:Transcript_31944/g.76559  ORF Transcript_31944/g.76559 Transcript_31944/m.76559 type:complete len:251 (-) Transcript_31944:2653-3405(-)
MSASASRAALKARPVFSASSFSWVARESFPDKAEMAFFASSALSCLPPKNSDSGSRSFFSSSAFADSASISVTESAALFMRSICAWLAASRAFRSSSRCSSSTRALCCVENASKTLWKRKNDAALTAFAAPPSIFCTNERIWSSSRVTACCSWAKVRSCSTVSSPLLAVSCLSKRAFDLAALAFCLALSVVNFACGRFLVQNSEHFRARSETCVTTSAASASKASGPCSAPRNAVTSLHIIGTDRACAMS